MPTFPGSHAKRWNSLLGRHTQLFAGGPAAKVGEENHTTFITQITVDYR